MKKNALFIIPLIILAITACKKQDSSVTANISNADAATMVASSLATNSIGVTTISSDVALSSQALITNNSACGTTKVDSISHQSMGGAVNTYSYKLKFTNKLTCNANNQPDNVTSTLIYSDSFNNAKSSSSSTGSTSFVIAGLTPASTVFAINGEYKSTGSFQLKADTTNKGTNSIDIVIKNLVITKATASTAAAITGGTATVTASGTIPKKGAFSFDGNLTFNGAGSATLTLNGTVYVINLATGVATKK